MSETYHPVIKADEIEERGVQPFIINSWPIAVCREKGTLYAFINRCTHAAAEFAPGCRIRAGSVMCPLHGARFKLGTGENIGGANYKPIKTFPLRETEEGWIEVAVPDEAPTAEHQPVIPLK